MNGLMHLRKRRRRNALRVHLAVAQGISKIVVICRVWSCTSFDSMHPESEVSASAAGGVQKA